MQNMRPSWPPPIMPSQEPGGRGVVTLQTGNFMPLAACVCSARNCVERRGQIRIAGGQHGHREQRRVDRAGLADGERGHRYAARHLHDRQQRILAR